MHARKRKSDRFSADKKAYSNAQMAPKMIRKYCAISGDGEKLLETAVTRPGLSTRAHDRISKVARTTADLDADSVEAKHLSAAFRTARSTSRTGPSPFHPPSYPAHSIDVRKPSVLPIQSPNLNAVAR